jgi:hypothetical protein
VWPARRLCSFSLRVLRAIPHCTQPLPARPWLLLCSAAAVLGCCCAAARLLLCSAAAVLGCCCARPQSTAHRLACDGLAAAATRGGCYSCAMLLRCDIIIQGADDLISDPSSRVCRLQDGCPALVSGPPAAARGNVRLSKRCTAHARSPPALSVPLSASGPLCWSSSSPAAMPGPGPRRLAC